ncbi:hypothetical protein CRU92_04250 [Arcobacter sp. FW59]|nr:hypothetical protein CRU92_04250 [Arcobacter sp. FW59]
MEIILDTNILIEILKNNRETIKEVEKYDISYSLIASTSIKLNLPFLSYNKKDFKFIKNINLV